jgi:hypothetical protein
MFLIPKMGKDYSVKSLNFLWILTREMIKKKPYVSADNVSGCFKSFRKELLSRNPIL